MDLIRAQLRLLRNQGSEDKHDDDKHDDVQDRPRRGITAAAAQAAGKATSSSSSSSRKDSVDTKISFLKKVYNGLPAFNDNAPDPGCGYEALYFRQALDPVFVPKHVKEGINFHLAKSYDPEDSQVRAHLEDLREAHWQLHAPKGFASLKNIPELQQLIAYTAADVVHYATATPGSRCETRFVSLPGTMAEAAARALDVAVQIGSICLYDSDSLFGQLCPGLQLCLAGEVASGLLCDSQPPPPDTPEHASALLLFLAAALNQVDNECYFIAGRGPPREAVRWATSRDAHPLLSMQANRPLLEQYLCTEAHAPLSMLLQAVCSSAGGEGSAASSSSSSSGGSSSSSGGGSSSSPAGRSTEAPQQEALLQDSPRGEVPGNVIMAALEVAVLMLTGTSSSSSSSRGKCSPWWPRAWQQQAQTEVHAALPSTPVSCTADLWSLLQKLGAASVQQQQQQQQQMHDGSGGAQQEQLAATAADVTAFISQQMERFHDATQELSAALTGLDPAAAAAAADAEAAGRDAAFNAANSCAASFDRKAAELQAAAEELAWCVAVLAGAVAFARLLAPAGLSCNAAADFQLVAEAVCPVRAALLFTAVEACFFGVREDLQQYCNRPGLFTQHAPQCVCAVCARQCPQLAAGADSWPAAETSIVERVLEVLQLSHAVCPDPCEPALGNVCSSSSSSTSSAHALPQQQQQEQQEQQQRQRPSSPSREQALRVRREKAEAAVEQLQEPLQMAAVLAWRLQYLRLHPDQPAEWFRTLHQSAEGQQQLSPMHLLRQRQPTTSAGTAAAPVPAGGEQQQEEQSATEMLLQRRFAAAGHLAQEVSSMAHRRLQADLETHAAAAAGNGQHSGGSWPAASQQQELCGSRMLDVATDVLLRDQGLPARWRRAWEAAVGGLREWQEHWAVESYRLLMMRMPFEYQLGKEFRRKKKERKQQEREEEEKERQKLGATAAAAAAAADRLKAVKRKMLRGRHASSSDSGSGSDSDTSDNMDTSSSRPAADGSKPEEPDEFIDSCLICAVEAAFEPDWGSCNTAGSSSSGGASSSSSSGGHPPGLYGRFPVSWSDPFMMRRLLWDLLGRVKPSAQAYLKRHANMCPHTITQRAWHMVVTSIARHLWAPPGVYNQHAHQQVQLVLQSNLMGCPTALEAKQDAARRQYALALNAAYVDQQGTALSAAVLSLQVLLALDPHAARVQPREELLFYTPSGFHAAVCKTLMQALRLPAAAQQQVLEVEQQHQEQEQRLREQREQQKGCSSDSSTSSSIGRHWLQAWSDALFPVYYVWWHIGLLAYHLQQQQQHNNSSSSSDNKLLSQHVGDRLPRQPSGQAVGSNHGMDGSEQQQQQQRRSPKQQPQQQLEQQASGKPRQLGRHTRLAADVAAASGDMEDGQQQQQHQNQQQQQNGLGALRQPAGAKASNSSSSCSSGCKPLTPEGFLDLYNNPDARLFAAGYAARQLSNGAQLERLLSNPPAPLGLQELPTQWVQQQVEEPSADLGLQECGTCQRSIDMGAAQAAQICTVCWSVFCDADCIAFHMPTDCSTDTASLVAGTHNWRVLDMLHPVEHSTARQQQADGSGTDAATAAAAALRSLPDATNSRLPQLLQEWLVKATGQLEASPEAAQLFRAYHNAMLVLHDDMDRLDRREEQLIRERMGDVEVTLLKRREQPSERV